MLNKSWFALGKRPFNFGEDGGVVGETGCVCN